MMGANLRVQAQFQPALNPDATFRRVPGVNHISCDGYIDNIGTPTIDIKVFAWDGPKQSWGYDFNGSKVLRSFTTANTVYDPEIALVSDQTGRFIYAIVLYQDPAIGAFYEAYRWSGTSFPTSPTYSGILAGGIMTDRVVSVAGDEYGHFVMVCDDGYNVRTTMKQLTGYIDTSTGNLVFGSIGTIRYSSRLVSQPDVDITYDANHRTTTDAVVVIVFTRDNSQEIISDFNDQTNLFAGATWDLSTSTTFAHKAISIPLNFQTYDQPSISINDGYLMDLNNTAAIGTFMYGYWPVHYGVAFREIDPTVVTNDILLYNALVKTSISAYTIGSSPTSPVYDFSPSGHNPNAFHEINEKPTIVLEPQEIETVVAWNFMDLTGGLYASNQFEGLANRFWYPYNYPTPGTFNDPYLAPQSFDMLINPNTGITTEVAISGYSELDLLYFYYESTSGNLIYKLDNYSANVLRKGITEKDNKLNVYPNPFTEKIQLRGLDVNSSYTASISDFTGRIIGNCNGLIPNIEKELNSYLSAMPPGCYLMSTTSADGIIQSSKLIKQ